MEATLGKTKFESKIIELECAKKTLSIASFVSEDKWQTKMAKIYAHT